MSVKVSPKFQVVIPEAVRVAIGITAGSRMEVIAKGKIADLVPVPDGAVKNRVLLDSSVWIEWLTRGKRLLGSGHLGF